jgi:hypothetical protein
VREQDAGIDAAAGGHRRSHLYRAFVIRRQIALASRGTSDRSLRPLPRMPAMKRLRSAAVSISVLGAALPGAVAWAQSQPPARLTSRDVIGPPLSPRALPPAPAIHKLSIGPLSAPADEVILKPSKPGEDRIQALIDRADRGDPFANYRLGLRYLAGDGVKRDLVEAFARIRISAEAGHPRAISLFYTLGAKLTAAEHARAYDRAQQIRAGRVAGLQSLSTGADAGADTGTAAK